MVKKKKDPFIFSTHFGNDFYSFLVGTLSWLIIKNKGYDCYNGSRAKINKRLIFRYHSTCHLR